MGSYGPPGGFPNLSQLLTWPTEHLTEAADHWEAVGGRSYEVASRVWQDALSIDWHGDAANALRTATHADMLTTSAVADQLHAVATIARSGASDLHTARSRVQYAAEDAGMVGFNVNQDLSVADRVTGGSAVQRAARQAQAETQASDIRQRAIQLVGLDQQIAGKITAAVAGIRETFPPHLSRDAPSNDKHVDAVDVHTYKQDPPAISRAQAAAGLKDVNRRIFDHNHIEKPIIDQLPLNDPRRSDFHVETGQLNAEKQRFLTYCHRSILLRVSSALAATVFLPSHRGQFRIFQQIPNKVGSIRLHRTSQVSTLVSRQFG